MTASKSESDTASLLAVKVEPSNQNQNQNDPKKKNNNDTENARQFSPPSSPTSSRGDDAFKGRILYVVNRMRPPMLLPKGWNGTGLLVNSNYGVLIDSGTRWYFHADRQYLKVAFQRERTLLDPTKPGAYLLSFE